MTDSNQTPENPFDEAAARTASLEEQINHLHEYVWELNAKLRQAEYDDLAGADRLRDLVLDEIKQRIRMRRLAAILGTLVIALMAYVMMHVSHWTKPPLWWPLRHPPSSQLAVVMFLAPAVSITAITISFLFGAFRRFKDDDLQIDKVGLAGEVVKSQMGG